MSQAPAMKVLRLPRSQGRPQRTWRGCLGSCEPPPLRGAVKVRSLRGMPRLCDHQPSPRCTIARTAVLQEALPSLSLSCGELSASPPAFTPPPPPLPTAASPQRLRTTLSFCALLTARQPRCLVPCACPWSAFSLPSWPAAASPTRIGASPCSSPRCTWSQPRQSPRFSAVSLVPHSRRSSPLALCSPVRPWVALCDPGWPCAALCGLGWVFSAFPRRNNVLLFVCGALRSPRFRPRLRMPGRAG